MMRKYHLNLKNTHKYHRENIAVLYRAVSIEITKLLYKIFKLHFINPIHF